MYTLGIDIGSTATKAVILEDGDRLVATALTPLGTGTTGTEKTLNSLFEKSGLGWDDITYTIATGYGRMRFQKGNKQISELSCHARGVNFLVPEARTIIDIGGQDAKVLRISAKGTLDDFVMNEKCAAGTGRFLDVMAGVLETETSMLGELDAQATKTISISSTCTVFAESEVISYLANGEAIPDVIAGIHEAVAKRTAGLVRRLGVTPVVSMGGGVAQNSGIVRALERELNTEIIVPEHVQLTGAIGAALLAYDQAQKGKTGTDATTEAFAQELDASRDLKSQEPPDCEACVQEKESEQESKEDDQDYWDKTKFTMMDF